MVSFILLIIGTLIILVSIFFIVRQSDHNDIDIQEEFMENDDELVITIESLENIINDINYTFNTTISEMEKKYELLETKIKNVDEKVLESYVSNLQSSDEINSNYENNTNNNIDIKNYIDKKSNPLNDKHLKISELKDQGLSIHQIAKELNMGTGEVILILNLRRSKK